MSHTLTYYIQVQNGLLSTLNRDQLRRDLLPFEGKRVELTIKPAKKARSLPQNAFYHGVVIPCIQNGIKETQGFKPTALETHEWLKSKFNVREIGLSTGEIATFPKSTTELSTLEFMEYIDRIKVFASEFLSIEIPEPGQQLSIL